MKRADKIRQDVSATYARAVEKPPLSVPRSVAEPRPAHEINVTGTVNLLIAAKEAGVRRFV
jgi:nucleoside-diphosphate-sugar epimerase